MTNSRRLTFVAILITILAFATYLSGWRRPAWKLISREDLDARNKVHTPASWARKGSSNSVPSTESEHPIAQLVDNFPLALAAKASTDLPPLPIWNQPSSRKRPENTPLYIGFTRNWRLLQQSIVSYIAAGWPPTQIYVVENTGTMFSNKDGQLSLQNPFFFNHTRLELLGVNVIVTPTLLSFAQLQNFFLWDALSRNLTTYFWGHMDTVVLSPENDYKGSSSQPTNDEFNSLYDNAVSALIEVTSPDPESGNVKPWGLVFFAYDALTLVNVKAYVAVGGWDTHIPFYTTDCDFYFRLEKSGYPTLRRPAGHVIDAGDTLDDLEVLFRQKDSPKASIDHIRGWEALLAAEKEADEAKRYKQQRRDLTGNDLTGVEVSEAISDIGTKQASPTNRQWQDDSINSPDFTHLHAMLNKIGALKNPKYKKLPRLRWQVQQQGGKGEPFYRDPKGFQMGLDMLIEAGTTIFHEKWGHRGCDLLEVRRQPEDAWQLGHDKTWPEDERR